MQFPSSLPFFESDLICVCGMDHSIPNSRWRFSSLLDSMGKNRWDWSRLSLEFLGIFPAESYCTEKIFGQSILLTVQIILKCVKQSSQEFLYLSWRFWNSYSKVDLQNESVEGIKWTQQGTEYKIPYKSVNLKYKYKKSWTLKTLRSWQSIFVHLTEHLPSTAK